jgi:hypothetical protein
MKETTFCGIRIISHPGMPADRVRFVNPNTGRATEFVIAPPQAAPTERPRYDPEGGSMAVEERSLTVNPIERASRAAETEHHCGRPPPAADSWKSWIPIVEAVLAAIREPSKEMIEAGARVLHAFDPNRDSVTATVREILEAALSTGSISMDLPGITSREQASRQAKRDLGFEP